MDLQKTAECPVCLELFTEPKVLACGHCFCKKCIIPTPRGLTGQLKVTCPECRDESSVPAGGFPTNYRLLDIVSNLESAGFRNSKDCGGCGRKTPKSELFSCTTCQAEIGNAHEVVICSLCYVKAHKTHDIVEFNKATPRDVQQARDQIEEDRDRKQHYVARVRTLLEGMTQEVMQAFESRVTRQHEELSAQLRGENVSKDDIEAKLAQSEEHATEALYSSEQMRIIIDKCGREMMGHATQGDVASLAATAQPAADRPTTSATARAEPSSVVPFDFGFGLYDGDYNSLLGRRSATPPAAHALSPDFGVFGFGDERPAAAAVAADLEERPPRARSPIAFRRPPPPTVTIMQGGSQNVAVYQRRSTSPVVVRPIQMSWAARTAQLGGTPERSASPPARTTARSPPPRLQATPVRLGADLEHRPSGTQDVDADAFQNMARTMDRFNDRWPSYARSTSLFPAADGGAPSTSGTAAGRIVSQLEPAQGRRRLLVPRPQPRRTYVELLGEEMDSGDEDEATARASLATKRARRNGGN